MATVQKAEMSRCFAEAVTNYYAAGNDPTWAKLEERGISDDKDFLDEEGNFKEVKEPFVGPLELKTFQDWQDEGYDIYLSSDWKTSYMVPKERMSGENRGESKENAGDGGENEKKHAGTGEEGNSTQAG